MKDFSRSTGSRFASRNALLRIWVTRLDSPGVVPSMAGGSVSMTCSMIMRATAAKMASKSTSSSWLISSIDGWTWRERSDWEPGRFSQPHIVLVVFVSTYQG